LLLTIFGFQIQVKTTLTNCENNENNENKVTLTNLANQFGEKKTQK